MKAYKIFAVLSAMFLLIFGAGQLSDNAPKKSRTTTSTQLADPGNANLVCYEYPNKSELVEAQRFTPNMVIEFLPIKPPMTFTQADGTSKLVDGLTLWHVEDDVAHCRIFGPIPKHVNGDPDMDTLGHEFLHCVTGSFHAE